MFQGAKLLEQSESKVLRILHEHPSPPWYVLKTHPDFSLRWVLVFLRRFQPIGEGAIQEIYQDIQFRGDYQIKLWLLRCRSTPPALGVPLVPHIRWVDLLWTLKQHRWLPGLTQKKIVTELAQKYPRLTLGEKITMARLAPKSLITFMKTITERSVLDVLFKNPNFTYEDASFIANYPESKQNALAVLAVSPRWTSFKELRIALLKHLNTPRALVLPLARTLFKAELQNVLEDSQLSVFTQALIQRIIAEGFFEA